MNAVDCVLRCIQALETLSVPYMLVGSFSSNTYGRPRSTQDADFVVQLPPDATSRLAGLLGPEFRIDPQMSFETITGTMRHIAVHLKTTFKIELFHLSSDPHDQSRFARRQAIDFEGRPVWLPTAEDVIVTKLRWSKGGKRAKDLDDVKNVLAVQHGKLDLTYIRQWCDQHGTRQLLEQLLSVG